MITFKVGDQVRLDPAKRKELLERTGEQGSDGQRQWSRIHTALDGVMTVVEISEEHKTHQVLRVRGSETERSFFISSLLLISGG